VAERVSKYFGYARVSTPEQSLDIQVTALTSAGAVHVFGEKQTGTNANREQLQLALKVLSTGDTLLVTRLDRLGRSISDLARIVDDLDKRGIQLRCLEQQFDTTGAAGKAMIGMLAVFAQFENDLRRERQREGIEKAKREGKYKGRKPSVDVAKVRSLKAEGMGASAIARALRIGRASVYRALGPPKCLAVSVD
jgi:DNA invertase Pin-like site-specific DNA recombinase